MGKISHKRERIRQQLFPDEDPWTGEGEKGWFRAPRTLPLVLELLCSKELAAKKSQNAASVFWNSGHVTWVTASSR